VPTAQALMEKMARRGATIPVAVDVVCGKQFDAAEPAVLKDAGNVADDDMIFDIGPKSTQELVDIIMKAGTVVWNGPVGAFELTPFDRGTVVAAKYAAQRTKLGKLVSVAGGGDTVAALNASGSAEGFTYVSTAGGAFLEWLEGKTLPGVAALDQG